MHCPNCGALMNRHADKSIKETHLEETSLFDPTIEGVIAAIYYCPVCGKVEMELEVRLI
jgi:predicted RNA-binding Zn-ribbon protein involved in translation (DUF1610 family)